MPDNVIVSEGKTTNEAIENGLKILKVSREDVEVKVLESEDKRSFFSILAPRVVKVELTLKQNNNKKIENKESTPKVKKEMKPVKAENIEKAKENTAKFLEDFSKKIGQEITYKIDEDEFGLKIEMNGNNIGDLIGYRGETLYAIQTIISAVANKDCDERVRILLDIENYKEKREQTLQSLARRIARNVEKTGKKVTLEPMQAYERKIIHSYLQNSSKVKTESIGEEPRRRVVISLK